VDEKLVNVSGKMMVLERLLEELFRRGSRVLVFSQFTGVLDVIEVSGLWVFRVGSELDEFPCRLPVGVPASAFLVSHSSRLRIDGLRC
jgi:hypothetical protein